MNTPTTQNLSGITGIIRQLVLSGATTEKVAREVIAKAAESKKSHHLYLMENKVIPMMDIAIAYAVDLGLPVLNLETYDLRQIPNLFSEELINKYKILPLKQEGRHLYVATSNPADTKSTDEIRFTHANIIVEPIVVPHDQLIQAIEKAYADNSALNNDFGDDSLDLEIQGDGDEGGQTGITVGEDETPVVKFINKMLLDAIRKGASDIHFEPYEEQYRVRFRMDGLLKTISTAPQKLHSKLSSRLKVMSQLDIAEKRLPQDGRIKLNLSKTRQMDFRVSTCPTLFGEKVVLRILDGGAAKLGIDKLGYEDHQRKLYEDALANPYGMILVTGPTGSGKTVSLYTGLNILNTDERNISTAEDPVEIRVPGINQVQMNNKKGMTFAVALRSFLRQDPDVVMVGEIRDLETAEIAVKAAQTGHLVLSTLHTNDAPQTVSRLMNMGIAPYNITSSVTLIIAQRLARKICSHCRVPTVLAHDILTQAGFTEKDLETGFTLYEGNPKGCGECNEGYRGRIGVYQVMPMLESIQKIVLEGGNALQIAEAAKESGVDDLRRSALKKVMSGMTSLSEADRVTQSGQ